MTNKDAALRYDVLNELLLSAEGHSISELVEACNARYRETEGHESHSVKNRQVLYDLEAMKSIYKVTIDCKPDEKDHRRKLFSYPPGEHGIYGEKFTEQDYSDINSLIDLLGTIVGEGYFARAKNALNKKMNKKALEKKIISIDSNKGLRNYNDLLKYIRHIYHRDPLRIKYNASFRYEREYLFQPYYLKQYNNRWFLMGWNYDYENKEDGTKGAIRNLPIDRIMEAVADRSGFSKDNPPRENTIDFENEYFKDIIGVTRYPGSKKVPIKIKVHANPDDPKDQGIKDWFRLITKPIHESQTQDEENFIITIEVIPNPELYGLLCQFEHIEVLEPDDVRKAHIARLKTMQSNYQDEE